MIDENLKQFATDTQWKYYLAYIEAGTFGKAARAENVDKSTLHRSVQSLFKKASKQGYSPDHAMTRPVPDGFSASRVSTNYDAEGNIRQQWVIGTIDKDRQEEIFQETIEGLKTSLPKCKPTPIRREGYNEQVMTVYPIGDHHFGMLAWGDETGNDDYDLSIGRDLLTGAVSHLTRSCPATERAALVVLGDYIHYDSMQAVTPQNRNLLDTDTRFPLMVRAAIEVTRKCIALMLKRHKEVHVVFETGNHDLTSTIWLREMFSCFYEDEPRVTIDTSPMLFHYIEFGKNLIGTHHGHGVKMAELPLVMASTKPEAWGRTLYRHILTGHIHHDSMKEYNGCKVESFRVLPPPDAYAAGKGYIATGRDMKAIMYHEEYGEIGRNIVNPAMLM